MRYLLCAPLVLSIASVASASPIGINVLLESYTTTVSMQLNRSGLPPLSQTRTISGSVPAADHIESLLGGVADASSSLFSAFANGDAAASPLGTFHSMTASATSAVDFIPTVTSPMTFILDMSTGGSPSFIDALVELRNLTTGELLWRVGYTTDEEFIAFRDTYLAINGSAAPPFPIPTLEAALDTSNRYQMTVHARANGQGDSQRASLHVRVPEAGGATLLILGVLAPFVLALLRR
jgi:hypothetical protein